MPSSLTIALIEDHESLRAVTASFLRKQGYRVFELETAEDMDDVVGGETIDLYLIDLNLPGEDGLLFAKRIRKVQPRAGIIMLTARGNPTHISDGYRSGADIYLVKPVVPDMLLAAIESVERRIPNSHERQQKIILSMAFLSLSGPEGTAGLNSSEAALLAGFARSTNHRLDLSQVSKLLGQRKDEVNQASIEVRITRLRKKIIAVSGNRGSIRNLRHIGYQLCIQLEIV